VAVVERPSTTVAGLVAVTIPAGSTTTSAGLIVQLPAEVVASVDSVTNITMPNGQQLPGWIRFSRDEKAIVLSAVPEGGLPVQLVLSMGSQRVVFQISEEGKL
jgi:hypothetical protein